MTSTVPAQNVCEINTCNKYLWKGVRVGKKECLPFLSGPKVTRFRPGATDVPKAQGEEAGAGREFPP